MDAAGVSAEDIGINAPPDGIADLPIVALICAVLAASAIGIGMKGLEIAGNLAAERKSIEDFGKFVGACKALSYGHIGDREIVELELPGSSLSINGKLLRLKSGSGNLRAEVLPLPLEMGPSGSDEFEIGDGTFKLELKSKREHGSDAKLESEAAAESASKSGILTFPPRELVIRVTRIDVTP